MEQKTPVTGMTAATRSPLLVEPHMAPKSHTHAHPHPHRFPLSRRDAKGGTSCAQ